MTAPILTLGETMVLVTPARAEPLETATEVRLEVGGAESNVAAHLVREGVPARWAGAVGDDPLGRRVLATLRERGVDVSLVRVDPSAPTGVYFKDPRPGASSVHYYRAGSAASRLDPAYVDELPIAESSLVHLSGITAALSPSSDALLDAVIARARAAGVPVSSDVNHRPRLWSTRDVAAARLLELARAADLVFVGRDEAEALWGIASAAAIRELLDVPRLVVKDGAVGAHAFGPDGEAFAPALPVDVVEAVGAGDAFAAGFLAADLAGAGTDEALDRGHRSAARVLVTTGDY